MSDKHLLADIATLTLKCQAQDKKNQAQNATIRKLRQSITRLTNSRAVLKSKYKALQQTVKRSRAVCQTRHDFGGSYIAGHKYDSKVVFMCLSLYFLAGCTTRHRSFY